MDIFEALEAGVDVFDGSYPTEALALNAAINPCSHWGCKLIVACIECFHFHDRVQSPQQLGLDSTIDFLILLLRRG